MEGLLIEVAKSSPFAAVLGLFMFFGFRFLAKLVDKGNAECAAREKRMGDRLIVLEDRGREDSKEREKANQAVMKTCAEALATNAETFKQLTNQGSGAHRALKERA